MKFSHLIVIHATCNSTSPTPKLNYNKGNYDALRNHLDIDWESTLLPHRDNIEEMWKIFSK